MSNKSLFYRTALYTDLLVLTALERSAFSYDLISSRQMAYHLKSSKNYFLVCTSKDNIVGYILTFMRSNKKYARIYSLVVAAEGRRQGIANVLVQKTIAHCQSEKIKKIFLEVSTKNHAAIALYKKHHFKIVRTILGFYDNGDDAYKMVRNLT